MANTLNKTGITTGNTVEAYHVTQSIDAFTGIVEYDIALSGSFNLTGSMTIDGLNTSSVLNILTFDPSTKALYTTSSIGFLQPLSSSIYDNTTNILINSSSIYNNTTNILINSSSIYNLSSSISSIPTSSGNFANTDLIFTGNRSHNTDGNILEITTDNGLYEEAWFYMQEGGVEEGTWIGYNDSYMKTNSNGNILEVRGKTVVQTLTAFTVNDSSNSSFDFIVKGGTDSNLFFTNTATDKIGIGTNTPNAKLDVNGNTIITGSLTLSNSLNTEGAKVRKYRTITLTDADYSTTPSDKINSDDDIILVINNTTGAPMVGEANFGIGSFLASPSGRCVEIVCIKSGSYGILLSDPDMVGLRLYLNDQSQANGFREVCEDVGQSITLMSYGLDASGSAWGNGY
jgi:hypothetical protein